MISRTRKMPRIVCCLLFCFLLLSARAQQTPQTNSPLVQFGEEIELHSAILKEDRPCWIYLPESYKHSTFAPKKYPVLYLLDGESNFGWASQLVQYLCDNLQIPDLIVVAIPNTDRLRDFTPTHDPGLASSGGGEPFEKFLGEELIPYVDANFRTDPYRILFGHSIGGVLAMDAFLWRSNVFQAFIVADPSLWWDNEILIRRAREMLPKVKDLHSAVFIATANHVETNSIKRASEDFFLKP